MEPSDASSSARAHELRASLGARREIEALLAEASATREAAVADADAVIEEAQQVSEQLLRESRTEAERLATDARLRAEGVLSRARAEAEDITRAARAAADAVRARAEAQVEEHRRRVRTELTEQVTREVTEQSRRELARLHERQQGMIGDIEASVRILGVSMEAAVANIAEMLGSLDTLRAHAAASWSDATSPSSGAPRRSEPIDHLIRDTTSADAEVGDLADEEDRPRSATEAFLTSVHLDDHADPPLPPLDDGEAGTRYAQDAMRATARSRTRDDGDEEALEVPPVLRDRREERDQADADAADASGKPLGWLFRSSS